jgi:hypothetical protein
MRQEHSLRQEPYYQRNLFAKSQGAKTGTFTIIDSASSKPQVIELSGTGT